MENRIEFESLPVVVRDRYRKLCGIHSMETGLNEWQCATLLLMVCLSTRVLSKFNRAPPLLHRLTQIALLVGIPSSFWRELGKCGILLSETTATMFREKMMKEYVPRMNGVVFTLDNAEVRRHHANTSTTIAHFLVTGAFPTQMELPQLSEFFFNAAPATNTNVEQQHTMALILNGNGELVSNNVIEITSQFFGNEDMSPFHKLLEIFSNPSPPRQSHVVNVSVGYSSNQLDVQAQLDHIIDTSFLGKEGGPPYVVLVVDQQLYAILKSLQRSSTRYSKVLIMPGLGHMLWNLEEGLLSKWKFGFLHSIAPLLGLDITKKLSKRAIVRILHVAWKAIGLLIRIAAGSRSFIDVLNEWAKDACTSKKLMADFFNVSDNLFLVM